MPRSFCRTPCMHCCCSYSEKFSFQCRFRPSVSITRRQCAWRVARGFFSLASTPARALGVFPASVAPLAAHAGVSCGGRTPVAADRGRNGGSALEKSEENWYTLTTKHHMSHSTLHRLKHGKDISMKTVNDLCRILNCQIEDVCKYVASDNDQIL